MWVHDIVEEPCFSKQLNSFRVVSKLQHGPIHIHIIRQIRFQCSEVWSNRLGSPRVGMKTPSCISRAVPKYVPSGLQSPD